jgi:uncharacterized protein (DUF2267 family)
LPGEGIRSSRYGVRYIGLNFPHTFIYKPGCEELVATEILVEIMKQVERTKKRRDIKEVRKAVRSIIARHKPPAEIRKALRNVLKDMAKLFQGSQSN